MNDFIANELSVDELQRIFEQLIDAGYSELEAEEHIILLTDDALELADISIH